jgi:hypothetical protein
MRALADVGLVLIGLGAGWAVSWPMAWRILGRRAPSRPRTAVEAPWRPGRPEAVVSASFARPLRMRSVSGQRAVRREHVGGL